MDSSPTVPEVQSERAEALAADATSERALGVDAEASLSRALERLPDAVVLSDAEAQTTK